MFRTVFLSVMITLLAVGVTAFIYASRKAYIRIYLAHLQDECSAVWKAIMAFHAAKCTWIVFWNVPENDPKNYGPVEDEELEQVQKALAVCDKIQADNADMSSEETRGKLLNAHDLCSQVASQYWEYIREYRRWYGRNPVTNKTLENLAREAKMYQGAADVLWYAVSTSEERVVRF